jgi:hypothetical protein
MRDAKTGSSWSQRACGGKDSIEYGQPEELIKGPLKSGIACFADSPRDHHLNGCESASIKTLVSLIGRGSNDNMLAILSADCKEILAI